jgi:RHS repeat-associated protein
MTYDAMGRPRSMTYPDGEVVSMTYNAQGLLNTLGAYVTQSNYNAVSELNFLKLGNNDTTTYTYNPQNLRLTDLVTNNGSGTPLQNLHYSYDNVGNIQQIVDGVRNETSNYQYDDLNRLLSASVSNGPNPYTQGRTYDPLGNITQRTDNGTPTNYTYDTNNKPHAVRQVGTQTYQYDSNGNMINRAGDTLHYDVEDHLTQVVTSGGVTTDYVYNGDGVRVKKVANGISTFYIGNYYVVSVNGQVTTASKYYYFGGLRVAVKVGGTLYYLHVDHLDSTSVATDTNGNPISKQTYLAFGAVRTSEGTSPTDFTFTGQRYDASSALMYYGARYYDPVLGRFTQADPILADAWNPQALNRYGYVYNNPVRYSDPTGYRVEEGCGCYIPPPPAPLPARYEDPSKYGEPPEPEVPPLPAEECHSRACKDDAGPGPSQPKVTPTPDPPVPPKPDDTSIAIDASALVFSIFSYVPIPEAQPEIYFGANAAGDVLGFLGVRHTMDSDPNAFALTTDAGSAKLTFSTDFAFGLTTATLGVIPIPPANVVFDAVQLGYDLARRGDRLPARYFDIPLPIPEGSR